MFDPFDQPPPPGAAPLPTVYDREARAELIRLLYEQSPFGLLITVINAGLTATALSFATDPWKAWGWYGAFLLVLAVRGVLLLAFRRHRAALPDAVWARYCTLGTGASGLAWGLAALALPGQPITYLVCIGFVISGMVAGAVSPLSHHLPTYRAYLLCALVPFGLRLAVVDDPLASLFLILVALFGFFMWINANQYHATLHRALFLGFANLDLVQGLSRDKQKIAEINERLASEVEERRGAEEALLAAKEIAESANRSKSQFLANMSHEIRTPMNGVLGMLEMLSHTILDAAQRGYVETAHRSAEGLLTIINDILDFSKIEAGKLDLEFIPFDARTLVEEVAALYAAGAQRRGLELICFIEPTARTRVLGDPTRLRQVLNNILGNAIKFTERGEVLVRVSEAQEGTNGGLCFSIQDSGIGMSPEQLGRLFKPFEQADGSTTRRYGGTGLGLAISKSLVELMGGTLEVQSTPGAGSLFLIRLPLAAQSDSGPPPPPDGLAGWSVLAVDDHAINLEILAHYLRGWDMRFCCVTRADEALVQLRQATQDGRPFAIALLDLQMPDTDGLALARAIRTDPVIAPMKLLLLSSAGQPTPADMSDIDLSLNKPVRLSQLRDALFQLLLGNTPAAPTAMTDSVVPLSGRVLLAEDNRINQKVAVSMLRRLGLSVEVVENGQEVLERFADGQCYDLVLMDIQMPVLDGYAATRALRERQRQSGDRWVPVIAMTANAMSEDRELCIAAGMDDYLAKPIRLAELHRVLAHWVPVST